MAETRRRVTAKEKQEIMRTGHCYVCSDLGLDHAGFDGYDPQDVDFDHYQTAFGNIGSKSTQTLPIHAASGGSTPDDADFEISTRRNCHRLRGNEFTSRAGYVQVMAARMQLRNVRFIDDVAGNVGRKPSSGRYTVSIQWTMNSADFLGKTYLVVSEDRLGVTWRRFLTTVRPDQTFTDAISQVRPAAAKTLVKMVTTFVAEGFPMFAPINARLDPCGHIVIFDGNHRATAHALSFGVDEPMPAMLWDIDPGSTCALRSDLEPKESSRKNKARAIKRVPRKPRRTKRG